ncbi:MULTISPECIES: DUF5067 domain-containing protein [unclassified Enterococcus]|uniref:DUF5067 domain-containing protein n=1 Tax=unclassified Enterococcus TaxID=2608891 RepID=UPI001CE228E3|nr:MULTISPECIES: DUF5067 domain-containing protein [unclassified Enterococcus]MCA5013663.1 DUF5067 domain-containing protein [Enterococcus sp. S23]MCA5016913.1 DUF5067 domain-containing protein [Enterococcus sp. S22(2020)]
MNMKKTLFFLMSLLILAGCQNTTLQKESEEFSANQSDYTLYLPTGWEREANPKEEINANAIFGGNDTKSNSMFYMRAESAENLSKEQLETYTKKYLKKYYDIKNNKGDYFSLNDRSVFHYSFEGTYEKKPSWLDIYYISMENSVVQFFFYSPQDNSHETRQKTFVALIESLKETKAKTTTMESSEELANKVTNNNFTLQVSTYEIDEVEDDQVLVIRFLYTNKEKTKNIPIEIWNKYVTVYQKEQQLVQSKETTLSDHTLLYLQENATKALEKDEVIESVVVYPLQKGNASDVQIKFDSAAFPNKQPLTIKTN